MTGRIKNLGLALLAALALVAMQAAVASAEPLFHSESKHTIGTASAEGQIVFVTDPGSIHCKKLTGEGTLLGETATELTGTPTISECTLTTIFGNIAVTFNTNGCSNKITADREVHFICPEGKTAIVSGPGCTVTVPPQSATNVQYTNVGSGKTREVIVHESATNIKYSYSGFTCGSGSNTENGKASGTGRTTGEDTEGNQVGIWWSDE